MVFDPPLTAGTLRRRYERFLADVELPGGETLTAHCPNTGSMLGCDRPGSRVWLSHAPSPKRKYAHTWELVEVNGATLVGIHTGRTNALVAEGIESGTVAPLAGYARLRREVRFGTERSRIDLLLEGGPDGRDCHVEVKNVTAAVADGIALFPDAVTTRGAKHLRELARIAEAGGRAVIFYCVQRGDVREVRPADAIDPAYGAALREAVAAGVEALAWRAAVSPEGVRLEAPVPVVCP